MYSINREHVENSVGSHETHAEELQYTDIIVGVKSDLRRGEHQYSSSCDLSESSRYHSNTRWLSGTI